MTRKRLLAAFAGALGLAIPALAFAADGDPDSSFGQGGIAYVPLAAEGSSAFLNDVTAALAPNGDVIVALDFSGGEDNRGIRLVRRSSTGALVEFGGTGDDAASEHDDGVLISGFGGNEIDALRVLADGSIVLLGKLTDHRIVARVSADGDTVAISERQRPCGGDGSSTDGDIRADGGLVLLWDCEGVSHVQRISPANAQEGDVTVLDVADFAGRHVAVAPDGRIFVVESNFSEPSEAVVLSAGGVRDLTYGGDGRAAAQQRVQQIAVDDDGRLVTGWQSGFSSGTWRFGRLEADGDPDGSFGTAGVAEHAIAGASSTPPRLFVQPDGKVVAVGARSNGNGSFFVRLKENGALDETFAGDGIEDITQECPEFDSPAAPLLQPDGKVVFVVAADIGEDGNCDDASGGGRSLAITPKKQVQLAIIRMLNAAPWLTPTNTTTTDTTATTTTTTTNTTTTNMTTTSTTATTATTPTQARTPSASTTPTLPPPVVSVACRSRRAFAIRLRTGRRKSQDSPIAEAEVRVNGEKVAVSRSARARASISLRNLPKGRFTVTIRLRLADGGVVRETRRYRTCSPKIPHRLAPLRTFPPNR